MSQLQRKTCAACDTECLEADAQCWACGRVFGADPQPIPNSEPTLPGDAWPDDPTLTWRRVPRWTYAVAVGAALVLVGSTLGFVLGRVTTPPPATNVAQSPEFTTEVLPTPPAPLYGPQPYTGPVPRPPVRAPWPTGPRPSQAAPPAPGAPVPAVPAPDASMYRPRQDRITGSQNFPPPASANPPGPSGPVSLSPTANSAVVSIANETGRVVDVTFGKQTLRVAPDSNVPFSLAGGRYNLRVSAPGLPARETGYTFTNNRPYTLSINVVREADGRQVLALREPAVDPPATP